MELLPKFAEYGIGIICVAGLFLLIFFIIKTNNETMKQSLKDNKDQTEKFIETTKEFSDIVKEQNLKINNKLDKISDKIDNLKP